MAVYTIVFQVDLSTVNDYSFPLANENMTRAAMAATRSTWIPMGFELGDETLKLKHGDQFTATDDEAYYLKQNYVKSSTNPNGVLTIVTETP